MRKTVMAGVVAAGALGAALAVGGAAYATSGAGADTDGDQQIVRVVEDDGTTGYDGNCPDKGGRGTPGEAPSEEASGGSGDGL